MLFKLEDNGSTLSYNTNKHQLTSRLLLYRLDVWNLLVKNENYNCLYAVDVIQTGGQYFYIKLQLK